LKTYTHKAYTFASHTNPNSIQSLQKSMLFPTMQKNKKYALSKKNKTLLTHNLPAKNETTEQTENIDCMSLANEEGKLVIYRNIVSLQIAASG